MTYLKASKQMRSILENDHHIPTLAVVLIWAANVISVWSYRKRSRNALTQLDDHRLRDIGVSREDAHKEALKRFWMP